MKYMRNKIGNKAAMCCCLTLTLMFVASTVNAAPKLTAEGAKKYFGDVNAPTEIDTRFGKKSLLPLQLAAGNKDEMGLNMIKALVEAGAIINKLGPDGDSALHTAAWRNTATNIRLLVKLGADVNLKNKQGETALLKAIDYRKFDAIQTLLSVGANPNLGNNKGKTAIHLAADLGDSKLAIKMLPPLLKYGGNLEALNKDGHTPLQEVLVLPDVSEIPVIQFLLDSGASLNVADSVSGTPLHQVASGNTTDDLVPLLDLLVKNGADLNNQDNMFQETPLHKAIFRACQYRELKITRRLLELGANPDLKNKEGTSARSLVNVPVLNCSNEVKQMLAAVSGKKAAKKPAPPSAKDHQEKQTGKRLGDVVKAYADVVNKAGREYQQAKDKAVKARGFSGLKTRQNVQARQKLFADFKDKSMALVYLLKESKSLAWRAVQDNKVKATQTETVKAVEKKFGDRITEDGLAPLKAQFYWADAYYNVFTILDQRWGAWSVDESKHSLNASDKALQAKLNKEVKAIGQL